MFRLMLTVCQPKIEHMNDRNAKFECIIFDHVAIFDEEIKTDDHDAEEFSRNTFWPIGIK